ncbi:MAG TPA: LysE family transporter [Bacteroidota bacterium]|nr:LysE family transporter [Bacteroidota bacterium]
MASALLIGIAFGFTLSIPPGPLALAFMKKAVSREYRGAMLVGIGAAVMDVFYNLLAAFASSALVVWLSNVFLENRWLSVAFQVLCVVVLLVLGIRYLMDKHNPKAERHMIEKEREQEERARRLGHGSPFFLGTLIAFTNLATPTFLPSMIAVVGYMQAQGFLERSFSASLFYAIGFGIGTTVWFAVMLRFIMKHHEKLSAGFITMVFRFAGGAFILFAIIIIYNILNATH